MTLTPPLATLTAEQHHLVVRWHGPGIAEVILSNPSQRNAMSGVMTQAWRMTMTQLARLPELRVVVVRGEDRRSVRAATWAGWPRAAVPVLPN